jgi:hypothetical protein
MKANSRKRRPKFQVGQVVYCRECNAYAQVTQTYYARDVRTWMYRLADEEFATRQGGHTNAELRPLTRREIGRPRHESK